MPVGDRRSPGERSEVHPVMARSEVASDDPGVVDQGAGVVPPPHLSGAGRVVHGVLHAVQLGVQRARRSVVDECVGGVEDPELAWGSGPADRIAHHEHRSGHQAADSGRTSGNRAWDLEVLADPPRGARRCRPVERPVDCVQRGEDQFSGGVPGVGPRARDGGDRRLGKVRACCPGPDRITVGYSHAGPPDIGGEVELVDPGPVLEEQTVNPGLEEVAVGHGPTPPSARRPTSRPSSRSPLQSPNRGRAAGPLRR